MSVSQEETLLHAHTIPISLPISNPSRPELGQNRAWNERTVKLTPNYGFLRPMKLEAGSIGGFDSAAIFGPIRLSLWTS